MNSAFSFSPAVRLKNSANPASGSYLLGDNFQVDDLSGTTLISAPFSGTELVGFSFARVDAHFFSPACQFTTTVSGGELAESITTTTKCWPSRATSKPPVSVGSVPIGDRKRNNAAGSAT